MLTATGLNKLCSILGMEEGKRIVIKKPNSLKHHTPDSNNHAVIVEALDGQTSKEILTTPVVKEKPSNVILKKAKEVK